MRRVHLFFPENDLALAKNAANYTAPRAATQLRRSGEALPLWYGNPGDVFAATGINAAWLDKMKESFGIDIDVYDYNANDSIPTPWGWSITSREALSNIGFMPEQLPTDPDLQLIRKLSARESSIAIRHRIGELLPQAQLSPAPTICRTTAQVEEYLDNTPEAIVKLPWSSSGRGLLPIDISSRANRMTEVSGMIRRQGYVTCEPLLNRRSDFAFLFEIEKGKASYCGLSLFRTEGIGKYQGNILMPQSDIEAHLRSECDTDTFYALPEVLRQSIEEIVGTAYNGALGIDMMTLNDSAALAMTEMNLRMTMGHVALRFYERYISYGAYGSLKIVPRIASRPTAEVRNCRLCSGSIILNPECTPFDFIASIN